MVEAGEQGRLLAEIARQRDHLHVERKGRQGPGDAAGIVAAAVVHVDDLDGEPTLGVQKPRNLGNAFMQPGMARDPVARAPALAGFAAILVNPSRASFLVGCSLAIYTAPERRCRARLKML